MLACVVDFKVLITFERSFFKTKQALADIKIGQLNFKLNNKEVNYSICQSMKQSNNILVATVIDTVNKESLLVPVEERLYIEKIEVMIMKFKGDGIDEYDDILSTLGGMGSNSNVSKS